MSSPSPESPVLQARLWRAFGVLSIASVVLLFGALPVETATPELGSPRSTVVQNLMQGSMARQFGGGYVEALSFVVLLFAATLLAGLLRGRTEVSRWFASMIAATAVAYVAMTLAVGFPAGAAAIYDGHHGASVDTVTTLNDMRNFAFFLSIGVLGAFSASVGAAVLVTRELPRWLGWSGVAVGVLCLLSVAGARGGAHNIASLVQTIWWVLLGIVALRRRSVVATGEPVAREAMAR